MLLVLPLGTGERSPEGRFPVGITSIESKTPKPGPYPEGRRCAGAACITVLSRSNPGPLCRVCAAPDEQAEEIELAVLMAEPPERAA